MCSNDLSKTKSYFYELPPELIAQHPLTNRSDSRLLVLDRRTGRIEHKRFSDITEYLKASDILVLNRSKVIPARLSGKKSTGAKVEIFLLNQLSETGWECLAKPGKRLSLDSYVIFSKELSCRVVDVTKEGNRIVEFSWIGDFWQILEKIGKIPLPPYIKRDAAEFDKKTYQTIYADQKGSVAAPTAGLHFTSELLEKIRRKGIEILEVILHIGLGTFRPVKTENINEHKMHSEHCRISEQTAAKINRAKKDKRRIIAVGTTTTRTLESFAENGKLRSGLHWTDIFIYPGKEIQIVDALITNFHMPESTLLMLVSAFAGYENIMKAYKTAVQEKYRFFSYGDSMLIL